MKEALFALPGVALTVICWGMYGSVLHKGQAGLGGDRLKPLICVGAAYFIIAIIVPAGVLLAQGKLGGWSSDGIRWSMAAGAAGALGALGIILALTTGGKPIYVMPLVFGGAPIVNVFAAMYFAKISFKDVNPIFFVGLILVSVGAATVLIYQPKPKKPHAATPAVKKELAAAESEAHQRPPDDKIAKDPTKKTS